MTEEEWLACEETEDMRAVLVRLGNNRKLRLFAAACLGECLHLLPGKEGLYVFSLNEENAAVEVDETTWRTARGVCKHQGYSSGSEPERVLYAAVNPDAGWTAVGVAWHTASLLASAAMAPGGWTPTWSEQRSEHHTHIQRRQYQFLCDIFGIALRHVSFDRSWHTSDVLAVARGIYQEKAFDRMPILADALQDAGCDNEEVLNHCRQPGVHVRGCWCVDLVRSVD
jgi:hypothetical protein